VRTVRSGSLASDDRLASARHHKRSTIDVHRFIPFQDRPLVTTDLAAIGELMSRFLSAVSFKQGAQPAYGELPNLFAPDARLIRNSGVAPEISTVDEFVRARQRTVDAGELTSFEETELAETTEHFGNVAHRFSIYAKHGVTDGSPIDVRGAISTQFIRTPAGWRISSMAWDDERPGLAVSPALSACGSLVSQRTVRRVVTGTMNGVSHVSRDDLVQPVTVAPLPGYAWHRLWSFDGPPTDPPAAEVKGALAHFPPAGGVRFSLYTVPPQRSRPSPELSAEAERELEELLPGRSAYMESNQDGMHRTPSVDLICVLSGEIWLELDAEEVHLREGDCVVQNGTRHAWRNKGDRPCTMAIVLVGAGAR